MNDILRLLNITATEARMLAVHLNDAADKIEASTLEDGYVYTAPAIVRNNDDAFHPLKFRVSKTV